MTHQHTHHGQQGPEVHRITDARESHTVERDTRVRKYTITMTVRVVCFILAFFAHGWLQWVFLVGAIFLPYIAVVIANGGADITKREPPAEYYTEAEPASIAPAAQPEPGQNEPVVIDGTLADEPEPKDQKEQDK